MTELRFLDLDALYAQALAFDQKHMVYDALSHFGITVENGEELAVFGEDGRPTGEGVSRTRAHAEGVLHGASHTYIYRKDESGIAFLLQRRSGSKDSYPLCLDISSAGHVERTSDHLDTACRELAEELGLTVAPEALTHAFTHRVFYESAPRGKRFLDAEVAAVYLLKMDVDVSTLSLQPSEVCEAVWLPADEILCRLEANDAELSLVKEEFVRVLDAVREMEK
jgi:isopentenyldiphosphate isomerase